MNFRNISSWCIRNPVGPIVLFVGLMLAGLISFARMQVNNAPDIDFPAAIVSVSQPGAAPNEMETQVTQRVESAVRGITGVDEINSTISEGISTTFVSFELGTPTDRAVNDVRNAISQIRGSLPEGIVEPRKGFGHCRRIGDIERILTRGIVPRSWCGSDRRDAARPP